MSKKPMPAEILTIVHVVFSSRIAGGEQHCIDLAHAQAALGHRVHVVGPAGSAIPGALGANVRYHALALPLLRGMRLQQIVARLGADVCHGHLGPACKAAAKVRTCLRMGTLHVGYKAHHHDRLDGLICVNQAQQKLLKRYRGAHRVIYNWAPERRSKAQASQNLRTELRLTEAQVLIGSVGRLHSSKGMDILIQAFRSHAPSHAVLAILGEGKDLPALQAHAQGDQRIHLLGFRDDVDAALASMDLFVSPSREEAFPLAILEAMRAGLPIISSATQGPLEMLAGQPATTLVPIADVKALGVALRDASQDLMRQPRHQRPKVAYDVSRYERSQAVGQVVDFYRTLLAVSPANTFPPLAKAPHAAGHV